MWTGSRRPREMSRRSVPPEGETRSYWPPPPFAISDTISLDDPPYFVLTWQPVACSNGFTHCGWAYPSQAMRLSLPSVFPTDAGTGLPASGGARPAVVLPPPDVLVDVPPDEPHPATSTTADAAASSAPALVHILMAFPSPHPGPVAGASRPPLAATPPARPPPPPSPPPSSPPPP